MTAMASCMFILGPCRHHRWRNPRAVMPQQGQRPNGLLACDVYRLAFGCFTRSFFWDQHLSRDWDHNVFKKWHCLSKSIEISWLPMGLKTNVTNQGYTKNLWELCNSEMWRWWKVNSPRAVSAEFLHPRLGEVVDSWRMRWHETTWDDGQTLQGLRPCPDQRCESWTTCAALHNKLSGDGQWNGKMMPLSALATRFASEYLLMPTCKRIMIYHVMSKDLTPIPGAHGRQNCDLIQACATLGRTCQALGTMFRL